MSNNLLNDINKDYNNLLMSNKLKNVKSCVKTNAPNTFIHKIQKQGIVESFNDFCKRQNDFILFRKLEEIYTGKSKPSKQNLILYNN